MQTQWQKIGGVAAFFEAFAYIVGFSVMLTVLQPAAGAGTMPEQQLGHILSMSALFKAWNIVIYVVFGAVLAVLVIALHARLAEGAEMLMRVASAFGLIWSGLVIATGMIANVGLSTVAKLYAEDPRLATVAWRTLNAVQEGLGGGVELVGGLWVILVSVVALRLAALPRRLNYIGIATGTAGVLTVIPPLGELGAVFGIGQIVWFVWLGIVMVSPPAVLRPGAEGAAAGTAP
ncbi:hypothetical protein RBA41_20300 [Massilia sp. CCM 9210]|uniref:DUF4386 family protein n=1 Tax=Massilia scottii TaxID=3057166 RepID=UPI0027965875|nr:DUF4386 family protein [Massilia sp. CCM 9210]MDQ1815642.1 hypothetical protein [Massilia sp. CCM 9210]